MRVGLTKMQYGVLYLVLQARNLKLKMGKLSEPICFFIVYKLNFIATGYRQKEV